MVIIYILAVIAILVAAYLFLIAPSGRKKQTEAFFAKNGAMYAHRGLHGGGVPENSLAAFDLACENGYGMELDVHITADDKLCVFHDGTLKRMCGVEGKVEEKTVSELRELRLADTDQYIPTFDEVLELVNGRAPLIVEVKGEKVNTRVCELTAAALDNYKGEYCIESFNPKYVAWFKKHRPNVIRGQLSAKMKNKNAKTAVKLRNFFLRHMLLNFMSRPDFLAYAINDRDVCSFRISRAMGGYPVGWTARDEKMMECSKGEFKAVIFENVSAKDYEL